MTPAEAATWRPARVALRRPSSLTSLRQRVAQANERSRIQRPCRSAKSHLASGSLPVSNVRPRGKGSSVSVVYSNGRESEFTPDAAGAERGLAGRASREHRSAALVVAFPQSVDL